MKYQKVRIVDQLKFVQNEGRLGFMAHLVIGYPTLEISYEILKVLVEEGVDFIEMQIPFTDPLADGPTIMKANAVALSNNITTRVCMRFMKQVSQEVSIPLLFMTYYNIIFSQGVIKFCSEARATGAIGLIVPDMPLEEEGHECFYEVSKELGLSPITILAPENSKERLHLLSRNVQDFVYLPSRKGVTGVQSTFSDSLKQQVSLIEKCIQKPIAVGFGVSEPGHVQAIQESGADIVVVGSVLIESYERGGLSAVRRKLQELIG